MAWRRTDCVTKPLPKEGRAAADQTSWISGTSSEAAPIRQVNRLSLSSKFPFSSGQCPGSSHGISPAIEHGIRDYDGSEAVPQIKLH
jgi:hypothetical protein